MIRQFTEDSRNQALLGLRVLEIGGCEGEYCGKLLADLGAEVLKLEPPDGSWCRREPPFKNDSAGPDQSLHFLYFNTNKKGITLDLRNSDGREIFRKLIPSVDVVTETFAAHYMEELGLGYDELSKLNPGLIVASVTSFGQRGPYRNYKGGDLVAFAMGGLMYVSGPLAGPPVNAPERQAFLAGSTYAAFAILVANWSRLETGLGQHIEVSLMDCLAATENLVAGKKDPADYPRRSGSQHRFAAPGKIYPCKDGFVHIFVSNSQVGCWQRFREWLGNPAELTGPEWEDSLYRRRHVEKIDQVITRQLKNLSKLDIYEQLQERHVPCAPVNSPADFIEDRQTQAREFVVNTSHPLWGELRIPGAPYKMSGSPWMHQMSAPAIGEHNNEIYSRLGLNSEEIMALYAARII